MENLYCVVFSVIKLSSPTLSIMGNTRLVISHSDLPVDGAARQAYNQFKAFNHNPNYLMLLHNSYNLRA